MKTHTAFSCCARFFVFGQLHGRTAANPLSLFYGSCRPRRILPCGKMLRWSMCLERRFACGKMLRGRRQKEPRSVFRGRAVCSCLPNGKQARWSGGRWLWPRSLFKGTYRPQRILPSAKCYEVSAGLARRFGLRQNATMCALSRAAFCFAGGL